MGETPLGLMIRRACEEARIRRLFAGMSRDDVRALWDAVGDDSFAHGTYDCADIHYYLNLIGDGGYCAI